MEALSSSISQPAVPAIVLVGFMGAGKTTAARTLAAALQERAVDSDAVLTSRLGCSIDEYFEREGERSFRSQEADVVCELLQDPPARVLSLGGGAITSARVRDALAAHIVVYVDVDVETAWQRVSGSRPLARDRGRFEAIYRDRLSQYEAVADAIVPPLDAAGWRELLPALSALIENRGNEAQANRTKLLWATARSGSYPAFVGENLAIADLLPSAGRRFLVTDKNVGPLHAATVGSVEAEIRIEPGEERKSLVEVGEVVSRLATLGMERGDQIVALGGGVVGDLAGFCAAIFQRGVRFSQIPTTLVGQVDAAYGGKVGVDLPEGKNYVGAFHQPVAVLADIASLGTLPSREVAAGWAEVIKTGLIAGGELWDGIRRSEGETLPARKVIFGCVRTKLEIVAKDERDGDLRQVLNLGHSVGHAIERATSYRTYRHGEAVGLGLLAALSLSEQAELRDEVAELLVRHGLPVRLEPGVSDEEVFAALQHDKKRRFGRVQFVLVDGPGAIRQGSRVSDDRVKSAIRALREP